MKHLTWHQFGLGLVDAAISSVANSVAVVIVDPINFNLLQGGAAKLGMVALASALIGMAMYLKNHRLPGVEEA